jgi:hypothetical protein
MVEFELEMARLNLIYKMVGSFENYTKETDEVGAIDFIHRSQGVFTICCDVIRDGKEYPFQTEVIFAGGYNVQCFHLRYITKTRLPKTGNRAITDTYSAKIRRMTKIEKIQEEIKRYENYITRSNTKLEQESWNDDQILSLSEYWTNSYKALNFKTIRERGAAKNFDNDASVFYAQKEEYRLSLITNHKQSMICERGYIRGYQRDIKRIQDKINLL